MFHLSFTREPVEIPDLEKVRKFLPAYQPKHAFFKPRQPMAQGVAVIGGHAYSYFKYQMHLASRKALEVYDEVSEEFEFIFDSMIKTADTGEIPATRLLYTETEWKEMDILIRKGRLDPEKDLKVVVLTGDGAAYDIGLASTSGDIIFIKSM